MSANRYYDMCCNRVGERVRVECRDGKIHHGYIDRMNRDHLFLRPIDGARGGGGIDGPGGPGLFYWGGWGFGAGAVFGLAWGTIIGLSFAGLWW